MACEILAALLARSNETHASTTDPDARLYAISQRIRKRIEEPFGWIKAIAGLGKVKVRGLAKVEAVFTFAVAAYNLVRIPRLLEQAAT